MARVTVEDCLDKIPNRFDLVVLAARRARDITLGRAPFVEKENDKPTVIALREIAEGKIDLDYLSTRETSPLDPLEEPGPNTALILDDVDEEVGEEEEGDLDERDEDEDEGCSSGESRAATKTQRKDRPDGVLQYYYAWEPKTDTEDFRWRLRLLQSHWRTERGLAMGNYRGKLRGACLVETEAKKTSLPNYLTENICTVVRREVEDQNRSKGKLYQKPEIYIHLLASQPLCFNLFGELARDHDDLGLASRVLSDMSGGRVGQVTAIEFEWSPGREDIRYTGDKSAFDIYVKYKGAKGRRGFLGIEVKYHENLTEDTKNSYPKHSDRYDKIAKEMDCFHKKGLQELRQAGRLQQMWRDHLLVGAHRKEDKFDEACFVFLYPEVNTACSSAVEEYGKCLSDIDTFDAWTLDDFVACLKRHTDAEWVRLFHDRYLDLSRLPL